VPSDSGTGRPQLSRTHTGPAAGELSSVMRETVTGGWVPIIGEGKGTPCGPLYGRRRPLLALDCLPSSLSVQQPLYGQQARPRSLCGGRACSRPHAQLSTSHGPILPRSEPLSRHGERSG
jgi:hypothetical protein